MSRLRGSISRGAKLVAGAGLTVLLLATSCGGGGGGGGGGGYSVADAGTVEVTKPVPAPDEQKRLL
ncbi:hypothetical protein [Promicromonospora panici]|uniref:hypothetical protein n=1 Tax=Promicromonospora panici TaxID=2219658 RepID=UPI00101CC6DA|nr:hypothetical protein [Promicromonospora panici]